jgi:hemerythrin-like domain-containing protein
MKRHPALAPLSRDHHHALVLAQRLRRASEAGAAEAARGFLEHWASEERLHFRLEEEVLLPAFAAHGGDPDHPLVVRTLLDHVRIRAAVEHLAGAVEPRADDPGAPAGRVTPEQLNELGARLADHVRLEENELFPLIEETLPEPALVALGARLRDAGA